jgi:predicted acyltransferase
MSDNRRNLALDVFRGITVCFMIIVNSPGTWDIAYSPLLHAPWHGFTPTDLVFPSFLFAVGNAMAFSMHKYESQGESVFWRKTLKRTLIIFLLGFLLYWFPFFREAEGGGLELKPLGETRILGVLQRIALCYFFASIVIHYGGKKAAIWFSGLALLGYWIISYVFGEANDPYSLVGNSALRLDLFLFGDSHLYHGEGVAFDPEGLLSTLPSIVNVIGGYLAGDYIRRRGNSYEVVAKLCLVASLLIFVALAWHLVFPINKKLWTSSFVLLTVGIDLIMLPALIYVIEIQRRLKWTNFFMVFGKNPLFIYVLADLLITVLYMVPVGDKNLQQVFFQDVLLKIASPINASLMFAIIFMFICWSIGYMLDKRKIYIRV